VMYVAFEDLEPVDLNDSICASRIVRVAGEKPVLDTLYNHATYVCSCVRVFKVPIKVGDKLMKPTSKGLPEVKEGNVRFGCTAGRLNRSAASLTPTGKQS
jgi:hypothetical protein